MAETRQIKTALISVFHKDGLDELLKKLNEEGVKFLSTGGTQQFIESLGLLPRSAFCELSLQSLHHLAQAISFLCRDLS